MIPNSVLNVTNIYEIKLLMRKKAGIFSVTPLFTKSSDINISMSPGAIIFFRSASFSQLLRRTFFLSEVDLGYVQLIKVTAPDGTIAIMTFNVT